MKNECILSEFDLEAVCYTPKTNNKKIFYKRRYAVYNLTIFNVGTKDAACYMWHEAIAKRGSNEIASCLWNYLRNSADRTPQYFFSDTCSGQNRNINVTTMFYFAVNNLNILEITQYFFEPGHSQMECDSVHAHIETKVKHINIFHPSGWYTAVQMASRKSKYNVVEMEQSMFFNFSDIQKDYVKNKSKDINGEIIHWMKIKCIQYRKDSPGYIFFKYDIEENDFKQFQVIRDTQRKQYRKYW